MPGYCVAGTVGHKVLSGMKKIEIDKKLVSACHVIPYQWFITKRFFLFVLARKRLPFAFQCNTCLSGTIEFFS